MTLYSLSWCKLVNDAVGDSFLSPLDVPVPAVEQSDKKMSVGMRFYKKNRNGMRDFDNVMKKK
jgi:hypothetical protein